VRRLRATYARTDTPKATSTYLAFDGGPPLGAFRAAAAALATAPITAMRSWLGAGLPRLGGN
jgi:hypothetical protein